MRLFFLEAMIKTKGILSYFDSPARVSRTDPIVRPKQTGTHKEILEDIDFKKVRFHVDLYRRSMESVLPYLRGASTKLALGDAPLR